MPKPASSPEPKLLEIFRTGQQTDVTGRTWNFTEADMQAAVAAYDPTLFAAPLVVGHPTLNDPAYGWVNKLDIKDGLITAEPKDVEAQFAALVNEGRFPKMSASWFPPGHSANPKPEGWYLRHVGFLGAAAPALPGLKPASFAADDKDVVTFDFAASHADNALWSISRLARSMRDWMIGKFSLEEADQVIPDYLVRDVETAHTQAMSSSAVTPGFAAPESSADADKAAAQQQSADFAARENDLAAREASLQAREQQTATREQQAQAAARLTDCASFAEQLITSGQLLPREKDAFVSFMAHIPDDSVVSFAAEDGSTATPKTNDWFRGFMQALPARVPFGERGAAEPEATASFAAPAGYTVNPDRLELHNKVLAYQAQHKCDYSTAVSAVSS
ncbi:MAG: peptidase [Rheinheimera sp.]|nr:MAG: peptidase [Rheinheimera sp.]